MSATRIIFDPKRQSEIVTLSFDFLSKIPNYPAETISTQVVAASVWSGIDPIPSGIVNGAASVSGSVVSQSITAGVTGTIYLLKATVTTSAGQTLVLEGLLAILPEGL